METALGTDVALLHPVYGRALSDKAAAHFMDGNRQASIAGFRDAVVAYEMAIADYRQDHGRTLDTETSKSTQIELSNTRFNLALVLSDRGGRDSDDSTDSEMETQSLEAVMLLKSLTTMPNEEEDPRLTRIISGAKSALDDLVHIEEQLSHEK